MQSPELRAQKGSERNGTVIRKGRRTSHVGEGSGDLQAPSEFCSVSQGVPGAVLAGSVSVQIKSRAPHHSAVLVPLSEDPTSQEMCLFLTVTPRHCPFLLSVMRKRAPPQNLHPECETYSSEGKWFLRPGTPSFLVKNKNSRRPSGQVWT